MLETPYTLAGWLADLAKIENIPAHNHWIAPLSQYAYCACQPEWVVLMAGRIRRTAEVDKQMRIGPVEMGMTLETPEELAAWLAHACKIPGNIQEHTDPPAYVTCARCWWVEMTTRIRQSVDNEKALQVMKVLDKLTG